MKFIERLLYNTLKNQFKNTEADNEGIKRIDLEDSVLYLKANGSIGTEGYYMPYFLNKHTITCSMSCLKELIKETLKNDEV